MSDMEKVRELTYKVEEYEKQKKELQDCYAEVKKQDSRKTTLFLYGACHSDLKVTLTDDGAEHVVSSLCAWYDKQIKGFKDEIKKYLTIKK